MKRELLEIQVARVIALIAVLSVHFTSIGVTNSPTDSVMFYVYSILNSFGRVGVPVFFFLSGLVLYYSYFEKEISFKTIMSFYWKRIQFIVIPYISICLFYFISTWIIYYNYTLSEAVNLFIDGVVFGGTHMHLYYLYVLIQFYFIFPLLLIFFKKMSNNFFTVSLGAIVIHILWFKLNADYSLVSNRSFFFLSYFSFFVIGGLVGIHYNKVFNRYKALTWKSVPYVIAFGLTLFLMIYYDLLTRSAFSLDEISFELLTLYSLPHSFDLIWMLLGLSGSFFFILVSKSYLSLGFDRINRLLLSIAKMSFGIYLLHPFFLMFFISALSTGSPLVFHGWQLLTAIIVTTLSIISTVLIGKLKFGWVLIGK